MNNAHLYNKFKNLQRQDAKDVLDAHFLLMQWKPGDTSLDLGCGDGDITINELLKRLPSDRGTLTAVDMCSDMLKFASENYPGTNVKYQFFDLRKPDVDAVHKDAYDHVFSFNCVNWIPDQTCAMKNIYEMLKNGGDFILVAAAKHHIFDSYKLLSQYPQWKEYMSDYENLISPYNDAQDPEGKLRTILDSVGFEKVRVKHVYKTHSFKGVSYLRAFAAAVNPFLKLIPTHLHSSYLDDYIKYAKTLGFIGESEDEIYKYTYSSVMAYGFKK